MNKCTTTIPTTIPWGFLLQYILPSISFGPKYDANLGIMSCQVIFHKYFKDVSREFDEFQVNTHLCKRIIIDARENKCFVCTEEV